MHDDVSAPPRTRRPCQVSDLGELAEWVGASGHDHGTVGWLTALGDITGALSGMALDPAVSDELPVELSDVLVVLARAASRRLGGRVVSYVPLDPDGTPSEVPAAAPDVCVPVVSGEAGGPSAVGHLHLDCADETLPSAADRAALEFLAGHAVELSAARGEHRGQLEAVDVLRREMATARTEIAELTVALSSNRQIGLAMGILVALERLTPEEAFTRLRVISQQTNRKLREVAEDVVYTGAAPPTPDPRRSAGRHEHTPSVTVTRDATTASALRPAGATPST